MKDDQWLTQEEVAGELGVSLAKVRPVIAAFSRVGSIVTRMDPQDNRYLLVRKDALELLSRALGVRDVVMGNPQE